MYNMYCVYRYYCVDLLESSGKANKLTTATFLSGIQQAIDLSNHNITISPILSSSSYLLAPFLMILMWMGDEQMFPACIVVAQHDAIIVYISYHPPTPLYKQYYANIYVPPIYYIISYSYIHKSCSGILYVLYLFLYRMIIGTLLP